MASCTKSLADKGIATDFLKGQSTDFLSGLTGPAATARDAKSYREGQRPLESPIFSGDTGPLIGRRHPTLLPRHSITIDSGCVIEGMMLNTLLG